MNPAPERAGAIDWLRGQFLVETLPGGCGEKFAKPR
jgi:hypothetical protein